ncbi:MAG: AAA family ATPase [Cellvibrionales bacterium]|nr:AAA family ATPase [Cellvibrionales bacterium]
MKLDNFIIFSGGPGSGKTTLINQLKASGFRTKSESGRQIVKESMAAGSDFFPWKNKQGFADQLFVAEKQALDKFKNQKSLIFWDRSIIDTYGYHQMESLRIPCSLLQICKDTRFNKKVFIFPPWEAIYENDSERKQSFKEAVRTYETMVDCYTKFGYDLIEMPLKSVEYRLQFVMDNLQQTK